jgi:hypothetical protein
MRLKQTGSLRHLALGLTALAALAALIALAALTALAGCATYTARLASLRPDLAAGNYDQALRTLEKERGKKDELLYRLERALILHQAGRWEESNTVFQSAEDLAEDLYTKSVSEGAFSLFTNDNTIAYRARPFEMAMIPYYRALNYIALQQSPEALVEARKASLYLRQYTDLTLEAMGQDPEEAALDWLRNSAFLQYFSGMLYEWGGETNDAFIAYRNAAAAYQASAGHLAVAGPASLGADLDRTGRRLGFQDEVEFVRSAYPEIFTRSLTGDWPQGHGEIVVLLEYGFVAHKVEQRLEAPIFASDDHGVDALSSQLCVRSEAGYVVPDNVHIEYWLSVAVPEMVSDRPVALGARVRTRSGELPAEAALVEDLEGRAFATFGAERGKILLKTFARGLTKYLAKEKADDQGWLAGVLANVFNVATETADTRSWLTLPNAIGMARLSLPAGTYDLEIEATDAAGQTVTRLQAPGVEVRAGDWTFVTQRIW